MGGQLLDAIARAMACSSSRREVARGLVGAVGGGLGLLGPGADARNRRKQRHRCRGGCPPGWVCRRGACACTTPKCGRVGCPADLDCVLECTQPELDRQLCVKRACTLRVCCPQDRLYAACPAEFLSPDGWCEATEEQAPSVCCPEAKVCGDRCCEEPFECVDPATAQCSGDDPGHAYARVRRAS